MNKKEFEERLKEGKYHPIVPLNAGDKLVKMDFSESNREIGMMTVGDTGLFSEYINKVLEEAGARYGVGGYAESRSIYSRSAVFDGEEPRRFHLGIDIWGKAGTPVSAPVDSKVHSFGYNGAFGDYGATIILEHRYRDLKFFTLYGHLSKASIEGLNTGKEIRAGEVFAYFGEPNENGDWPPHLHFQIIRDIGSWAGDYPGVCPFSERNAWIDNGADPSIIAGL